MLARPRPLPPHPPLLSFASYNQYSDLSIEMSIKVIMLEFDFLVAT